MRAGLLGVLLGCWAQPALANRPVPVLNHIYPAGGQAGSRFEVEVAGSGLDGLTTLQCSHPGLTFKQIDQQRFAVEIPEDVPPGQYDLRTVGKHGISSARTFVVGLYDEQRDKASNDDNKTAQAIPLNCTINGRIEENGDRDHVRFPAKQGERILIECWAERLDSPLRAVLEVFDQTGKRISVNRGYFGIDPLVEFTAPADGEYTVRIFDLVYAGSADHIYRLDIGTAPRVAFAVPAIVQRGKATTVSLYGWNLKTKETVESRFGDWDRIDVEFNAAKPDTSKPLPLRLRPPQATIDAFAYQLADSHVPVMLATTDLPVVVEADDSSPSGSSPDLTIPCAVSGQLVVGDERDTYSFTARRGEVLWLEGFGERLGSPVDLDVAILDSDGETILARFSDEVRNIGDKSFPSQHLDPAGRWVAPRDGRYHVVIRNLIGGLDDDPRRVYALTIRRQEPDFDVVALPHREGPESINLQPGGRKLLDVLAFRRRGMTGSIRVRPRSLPPGVSCEPIWLGPGVVRAPLVLSAEQSAEVSIGTFDLIADSPEVAPHKVSSGTMVRSGNPNGWGRLTADSPVAVSGPPSPLRIIANGHETRPHHLYGDLKVRHSPGGILDVAVHVERADASHQADVKLIGIGLPPTIQNRTATIDAGKNKGYISFYLPPSLGLGHYSLAVRAETTVPDPVKPDQTKTVTVHSNVVSFEVHPPAFVVEIDPYAPKMIARGEVIKVNYTARRINGFINKIHTELYAADEVIGIRGRGVTFVGQTDSGTIQIVANDDAQLGKQPFLRLYAVGVLEDEPVYHGSCWLDLEIVE